MRKTILAGNWKMNTTVPEGLNLFNEIKQGWIAIPENRSICIIAPPFTHLPQMRTAAVQNIYAAGQNCSAHQRGAYTGEISADMLRAAGADFVILGHSERRTYFGESNELLKLKVERALESGLAPIFCCGELEQHREGNLQEQVVSTQLDEALFHLNPEHFSKVIVAYEPVWAIGTGKTATPLQAQEMHRFIRNTIEDQYGKEVSVKTSIIYGGSCNPGNAESLFRNEDVDGGLIGGAALVAGDFLNIAEILNQSVL